MTVGVNISRRHMGRSSQLGGTIRAVRCTGVWLDRAEGREPQLEGLPLPGVPPPPPRLCECCVGLLRTLGALPAVSARPGGGCGRSYCFLGFQAVPMAEGGWAGLGRAALRG